MRYLCKSVGKLASFCWCTYPYSLTCAFNHHRVGNEWKREKEKGREEVRE